MLKLRRMVSICFVALLCLALGASAQYAPVDRAATGMGDVTSGDRGAEQQKRGMRGGRGSVTSPEIAVDNKVTFRILAPQAASVTVSGDWGGRGIEMTKDDQGVWSVTVGPLESELYGYTFNVDGARVWYPANHHLKRDGRNITSVVIIPGKKGDLYSVQDVPHGTLAKVWYDSPILNLKRRLFVYTPPGYETGTEKYPVLYLLHGAGGDEDAWTSLGRTPQILDNLIAQGQAQPMLVVMTNGNANQSAAPDARPAGGAAQNRGARTGGTTARGVLGGSSFPDSLAKDVVPFIEKSYRVIADKDNRAVAGLSMGGGHTVTVTLSNPDMFGYIGVFSAGTRSVNDEIKQQFQELKKANPKLYWVGCGEDDFLIQSAQSLVEILKELKFNYSFYNNDGGHTWTNWRIYLSELAPLLFK